MNDMTINDTGIKVVIDGIQQTLTPYEALQLRKALKKSSKKNGVFKSLRHIIKICVNEKYSKM